MPKPQSLPRCERLTRKSDFERVFKEGEKHVGGAFLCFVVRDRVQGRKLGFAVSKRVGGAVVRNRVKRYIREIYRVHRPELVDDVHLVFVARPSAANIGYADCYRMIRRLFQKGELLDG